jgi:DNA-binding XRE family transcriptional regulator
MKKSPAPEHPLAKVRNVIGKSQSQFATMVGVSKHTIISVENGRNQLTAKLARRILIATGINFLPDHLRGGLCSPEKCTRADFNQWRDCVYCTDEDAAKDHFEGLQKWIYLVFRAAAKSGLGGNRDRLPAVYLSLINWLEEVREVFKLEKEIDDILDAETRRKGTTCVTYYRLRTDKPLAQHIADAIGITLKELMKAAAPYGDYGVLWFKYENRCTFSPLVVSDESETIYCTTRKLLRKPKYWLVKDKIRYSKSNQL